MNVGGNDKNWMEGSLKNPLLRGSWEAELLWPAVGPPWVSSESAESHQMLSPWGRSVDPSTRHLVPVLTLGSAELIRDKTDSRDTVFRADLLAGGKRGQKYNTNILWDSSVLFGSFSSFLEEFSLQELSLRQLLPRRQAWMPASPGARRWEEAWGRVPQASCCSGQVPKGGDMGLSGQSPAHSKELRLLEESSVWFSLRHETVRLSSEQDWILVLGSWLDFHSLK